MKCRRFCSLLVPFLLLCPTMLVAQSTVHCLFIGNSYVYTNDLPQMIHNVALDCGDTLVYASSVPGGATFQNHLANASSQALIRQGNWDAVVLQEQSQLPAFPWSQVQSQCFPYAKQLCDSVRRFAPSADVVFYITWGRKNGDAANCANYAPLCTYEGMDSLLYERYTYMASQNAAVISPVGRVWHRIRDTHPELELYSSDESHPSLLGTYAAALTFNTILFKKAPLCVTNNCALDTAAAAAVREVVKQVVYDSLDFWYRYANVSSIVENMENTNNLLVYPNPATGKISVALPGNGVAEITIYDAIGRAIYSERAAQPVTTIEFPDKFSAVYFLEARFPNGDRIRKKIINIQPY